MTEETKPQLQMLWPKNRLDDPPAINVPDGYTLRTYIPGDAKAYLDLMLKAGFDFWNEEKTETTLLTILPGGFFLIVHDESDSLVATTLATHRSLPLHPYGGELGWVAGDPDHKGKGLGLATCSAVVKRYLDAGYKRIYLQTDDWRLPAIKTYLKLGFLPFLFDDTMQERWKAVCKNLSWPEDSEQWLKL